MKSRFLIILFVISTLCGCSSPDLPQKHISFIYSFTEDEMDRGEMPRMIVSNLQKSGYQISYDEFFLDAMAYDEKNEIRVMLDQLNKLYDENKTDLLVIFNDQASYSAMITHHKIFDETPTILLNTHYPNYKLLEDYKDKPLYCVASEPDFKINIDFLDEIFNHNARVFIQYELVVLGKRAFSYFEDQIKGSPLPVLFYYDKNLISDWEESLAEEIEKLTYRRTSEKLQIKRHFKELQEGYPLTPTDTTTVCIVPIRYMDGVFLFSSYEFMSRNFMESEENDGYALLLNDMDATERGLCRLWSVPIFSCFCEGFDQGLNIAGGYFASASTLAGECSAIAAEQFASPEGSILTEKN